MARRIYILCTFFLIAYPASSQHYRDEMSTAIQTILFENKIVKKVFFKSEQSGKMEAYIYADTLFQKRYPDVYDNLFSNRFIVKFKENADVGNLFIFIEVFYNYQVELFVVFDRLEVTPDKKAKVEFHTTSLYEREKLRDQYVQVECSLSMKNGKWKTDKLKIKPSKCCDKIIGDLDK